MELSFAGVVKDDDNWRESIARCAAPFIPDNMYAVVLLKGDRLFVGRSYPTVNAALSQAGRIAGDCVGAPNRYAVLRRGRLVLVYISRQVVLAQTKID